jgi:hypothetical protein
MGNQQSAEKEKPTSTAGTRVAPSHRVNRRQSVQALQVGASRGAPADPSATPASAIAQTSSRPFETSELAQYVQASPSPEGRNRVGRMPSRRKKDDADHKSKHSPVSVPQSSIPMNVPVAKSKQESVDKSAYEKQWNDRPEPSPYDDRRYVPPAELRPQRMPLPIAGEHSVPDSPTLGPLDTGTQDVPIFDDDDGLAPEKQELRRKSSVMSVGTPGDDDLDEELPQADPAAGTVQTIIEWTHAGNRVFITGTFANWERKFKMHQL